MVPARLTLRNFLSYADACPPIDLEEIGLACLCGDNGHGKSSLIDAITWALWGRARGRDLDALVHRGRREMEVDFEFLVGSSRYRVIRRRLRIGARGVGRPSLEFQTWSDDGWKPLTEPTIAQTEQAIERTLHLSFETFINSALLLQGKADLFAAAGPANRKRVLADILDLAKYDRLEAEARERRRRCALEVDNHERTLTDLRARLAPLGELKERLCAALVELRSTLDERATLVDELQQLQSAQSALDAQRTTLADLERQLAVDVPALHAAEAEVSALRAALAADEPLLAAEPAICRGHERLEQARAAERQWSEKLIEVQRLDQRMQPLMQQLAANESRFQERVAVLRARRDEAMQEAGDLANLDARLLALRNDEASIDARAAHANELQRLLTERRAALLELRSDEAALLRTHRETEARHADLQVGDDGGALCPVCRSPLSLDAAMLLEADARESLRETREKLGNIRRAIGEAEAEICRLTGEESALRSSVESDAERVRGELARTEVLRERAGVAADRVQEITHELDALQRQAERSSVANEARATLRRLTEERDALAHDGAKHRAATRRVQQLLEYDARYHALTAAIVRRETGLPMKVRQEALVDSLRARIEETRGRVCCLERALAEHPDPRDRIDAIGGRLALLEQRRAELDRQIGGLESQIRECETLQNREAETRAAYERARREEAIYADLVVAFGRNGVQAFIVDAVVPEIEAEANRLLDLMSGGRMSVQLRTQRETRAGDLVETLDLVIADESGPRDYEMYSGGEAFRINLALRIALARLLARRAGAPLPTLIIDEGFGSQDAGGRERMVEAVSAIRQDFRCLLVVTHIEEFKQQFDTRIEVHKGERGSIAEVVRV